MKIDILQVTENDEIVVWVKATGKIYKKKVAKSVAGYLQKRIRKCSRDKNGDL